MKPSEDLKNLRNWILGVVGFATTLSTFLVTALHFPLEQTIGGMSMIALVFVIVVYLIGKSEQRALKAVKEHRQMSDGQVDRLTTAIENLTQICRDTEASTLRIEMNDEIHRHPENHDTILKMAERYFVVLGRDWVETDLFLQWKEDEEQAGRKVHIPPHLLDDVMSKKAREM